MDPWNKKVLFGKYKGKTYSTLLKDASYCKWLYDQEWVHEPRNALLRELIEGEYMCHICGGRGIDTCSGVACGLCWGEKWLWDDEVG